MNYKKKVLIRETLMTCYALSLLTHGVQLVLFFFSSSACLSPTSPPPPLPLRGKSQEHSSIRERHGTFSSDSLKQEWANILSSFFSSTVCWHKVPSGPSTFHRCWKILLGNVALSLCGQSGTDLSFTQQNQ